MMKIWTDITKDWEKLSIDTYKFLFEQTKERYNDIIEESESITNKAFKLISITGAFSAVFISFKFQEQPNICFISFVGFLYLINISCLIKLLFPKSVIFRGSPPNEILVTYLDDESDEDIKSRLAYYQELIRYQDRIEKMEANNSNRQRFYKASLILTLTNSCISILIVLYTIYHRP